MLPIFAQLGSLYIYTYGIFLVLGFFWSCFFVWKHIRISKFEEETAFDIVFISFGGMLVIGRLVYCLLHFQEFGFNILKYLLANGYPGISPAGMFLGGIGTLYIASVRRKIKFTELSDYFVPSLFIFTLFAEVGAFVAGIEPGVVWKWFRHPVALYKAALLGLGTYVSISMFYNVRKEKIEKGALLFVFFGLYSVSYVAFHFLEDKRTLLTESPFDYWFFVILLLTSCFYFVYYFRVFIISGFQTFISSCIHYVKTIVKNISLKTEKPYRGGAEKNTSSDRKP